MVTDLKNKNAIVCGSTQGIGKASAMELASLGANVTLLSRNEESLKRTMEELPLHSWQRHDHIVADLSQPEALREIIGNYAKSNAPVHILVNNAGGPPGGKAIDAALEEFEAAFSAHLKSNHVLVRAVVEGMKSERYGRIINIISTSVKQPLPNLGVSNTIRGAVASWAKTLAHELGAYGITVNNVLPGATMTGRLESIIRNKAEKTGADTASVSKEMLAEIPAGRFATAQEVAAAVAFLATPSASYINGINLPVDGGRLSCL